MSEKSAVISGGCMCGAVRYEAEAPPLGIAHCHCEDCRNHTGAPVVTYAAFKVDRVRFTKGTRKIYGSSPGVGRAFCGHCGTPLSWEGFATAFNADIVEFYIGTLDDPDEFMPDRHWFHSERIAWFEIADALPRYHRLGITEEPYRWGPIDYGLPE